MKIDPIGQPKFKKGDVCVYVDMLCGELIVYDIDMVIAEEPHWYPYENHPNKGYWNYPIIGRGNECDEDHLRLYTGQEDGDPAE